MKFFLSCFLLVSASLSLGAQAYTPSPLDWSQQVIYFLVTDRFADGDTSNNDLGHGEFDRSDVDFYHGGDLQGLIDRLDYIKAAGATAVWHTPQVQNQWISPAYGRTRYAGYHGYWAQDFYAVDPHLGDLALYKKFVKEAHSKGLLVIQDIVINHMGDFYSQDGKNLAQNGVPSEPAFPFDGRDKAFEYFNFNGTDQYTQGFGGLLDDLKTDNPAVVKKLIDIFKFWIKESDIDGYRIDTVKYVPMKFWREFIPAVRSYAASLGKKNFIIFGENFEYDHVINGRYYESDSGNGLYTVKSRENDPSSAENSLFTSMLDFSVSAALNQVFVGVTLTGGSMRNGQVVKRDYGSFQLLNQRFSPEVMGLYSQESRSQRVTFLDNHDMTRFLHESKASGDSRVLINALAALYTLPGVPTLYYGTEQGYKQPRKKKGKNTGSENRQELWTTGFQTSSELFQSVAKLGQIRQKYPELGAGQFVPWVTDGFGGDLWIYSRLTDKAEILVLINRGKQGRRVDVSAWAPEGGLDLWTEGRTGVQVEVEASGFRILKIK